MTASAHREGTGIDLEARAQLDPIRRIPAENGRLLALFRSCAPADWSKPTRCHGWTLAHLAAHLVLNAKFLAESVRTALSGPERPKAQDSEKPRLPFGFPNLARFEDWRSKEMDRLTSGGPQGLLAAFEASAADLEDELTRINLTNAETHLWHPSGEAKLGYVPTFRFLELQYHEWDARAVEDPAASLWENALPLMTDRLPMILGRACRLRTAAEHPRGRVRILLTDPARNFLLDWKGEQSRALVDDGGPVEATLAGKSNTFLLLVGGRANRSQCEKDGAFRILGNDEFGKTLAEVLFRPLRYL